MSSLLLSTHRVVFACPVRRTAWFCLLCAGTLFVEPAGAAEHWAGAAKVDITHPDNSPAKPTLYAKALVLKSADTKIVIITVDAVAIGEIGSISNDYLAKVRKRLEEELQIKPANVLVNASHCHGIVCRDIDDKTVQAVKMASEKLVPVSVFAGTGREDRVMTNRRLKLKNGKDLDVRHAYSLPADEEVAEVGPIDPEIGVLRFDDEKGRTVAAVYNFACHPIQGVPDGSNTADMTGFASGVIEDNLDEGAVALFVQGCAGDINPVYYKDVNHPRDAEVLGNMLGLSTLKALRKAKPQEDARLVCLNETLSLPRADFESRIQEMESRQTQLVKSLRGTSLNLKTFLPLMVKYNLSEEFPSYYSHRYFHEKQIGQRGLATLDAENRRNLKRYVENIQTMEEITRLNTNLALLRKHQAKLLAAGKREIDVELLGIRIGEFVMVTFPGELVVRIGLNIKKASPYDLTFVAGYTNGYIYYAPTAEQLQNRGGAQEDSDCLLAPEWQAIFEKKAAEMLRQLKP